MNNRELRDVLVETLRGVRTGEIDPKTAFSVAKVSDMILKSALAEAAYNQRQGDDSPIDFFESNYVPTIRSSSVVSYLKVGSRKPTSIPIPISRTSSNVYLEYIVDISTTDFCSLAFTLESIVQAIGRKSGKRVSEYTIKKVLQGSEFTRFKGSGNRYYALNDWCEEVDGKIKLKPVHEPVALQHAVYELEGISDFTK